MTEDDDISAKVSACSEGLTEIIISKGIELVGKYGDEAIIVFICLLVAGYVVTKVDVPKFIKYVVCLPTAIAEEKKQLKLKTKQLELENKE